MSAKAFLLQECANVSDLLNKTLRFDYGLEGSSTFYAECATRLAYVTSELNATAERDIHTLTSHCWDLNDLAELICRIERSSLGEYSWPFVHELKKITAAICTEPTLSGHATPPEVFVLADGGLDKYAIYAEKNRPTVSKVRLLTIVFPKSLKHFVLYHSILGHEIGHAIWSYARHQAALSSSVITPITAPGSVLGSEKAIFDHLFAAGAPQAAKDYLALLRKELGIVDQATLFNWAKRDAWIEEILCDLIGLTTFGPSFVGAQCELLCGLDPSGVAFGDEHPPVAWRVNMILKCARILGYDTLPPKTHPSHKRLKRFWDHLKSFQRKGVWFDVIDEKHLRKALKALTKLLSSHKPAGYAAPSFDDLEKLTSKLSRRVPPVGFAINSKDEPVCSLVDFRHILYAGWVASVEGKLKFELINKLCEHAIMQQHAIDVMSKTAP